MSMTCFYVTDTIFLCGLHSIVVSIRTIVGQLQMKEYEELVE